MSEEPEFDFKPLTSSDETMRMPVATVQEIVTMATMALDDLTGFLETNGDNVLLTAAFTKLGYIKGAAQFYLPKKEDDEKEIRTSEVL
jgi:Mor family transcriptional regulator